MLSCSSRGKGSPSWDQSTAGELTVGGNLLLALFSGLSQQPLLLVPFFTCAWIPQGLGFFFSVAFQGDGAKFQFGVLVSWCWTET